MGATFGWVFIGFIAIVFVCILYDNMKCKHEWEQHKFEKCGLHPEPASAVACPLLAESPLSLECRVTDVIPLGSHDMFIADILAVDVDESLIDGAGKLHLERAGLAAFAHGDYFELGKKIGSFGFSVRKKKPKQKTGQPQKKRS